MSHAYHSDVPVFLKSQGPFAIYDHSLKWARQSQPSEKPTATDRAALEAVKRYEEELKALKQQREQEKQHFYGGIAHINRRAINE